MCGTSSRRVGSPEHLDGAPAVAEAEFALKDDGKWLQIADDRGRWIYRAHRMMITPHDLPSASTLPTKGAFKEYGAGIKRIRALTRAFTLDGRTFVAEDGVTLTKTDQTLAVFRNGLLLISPAVFLMAGLAGHWLSRSALKPVAAIAREAQRIHHGNLQTRLPQSQTHDELAHLSATLNEMLERLERGVRSVRDFTAYASHELRTPVALIRTEADLGIAQFQRSNREYREAIGGHFRRRLSACRRCLIVCCFWHEPMLARSRFAWKKWMRDAPARRPSTEVAPPARLRQNSARGGAAAKPSRSYGRPRISASAAEYRPRKRRQIYARGRHCAFDAVRGRDGHARFEIRATRALAFPPRILRSSSSASAAAATLSRQAIMAPGSAWPSRPGSPNAMEPASTSRASRALEVRSGGRWRWPMRLPMD